MTELRDNATIACFYNNVHLSSVSQLSFEDRSLRLLVGTARLIRTSLYKDSDTFH